MRDHRCVQIPLSGSSMAIRVKYFASLREQMGRAEDGVSHEPGLTVAALWQRVAPGRGLPDNVLVAINHEYARVEQQVADGDEVAFFPPVTGG